ncbi:universal stress protein [Natronocalculus amylovorans]|uniref:Universal stress protein n=1 Tax=Natronocalculus amylovorans TaxID=2917812 RepID=A0AAE3FU98_9EURY|nr:universal stress protein [Natronocalculus amylovorans]MCL9815453.1 universal stress protein [Natronocalculus amylovorans]NUE02033.1 universal stress protein [Halorubraceae archaeon YAN]
MIILAAVDNSEHGAEVVAEAAALATAYDLPVHAIHALTRSEFVNTGRERAHERKEMSMQEMRDRAQKRAQRALDAAGVSGTAVGKIGKPGDEISKYATANDARYIVVGPRRRSRTGKAVFGSVTQSVILQSEQPVVTVMMDDD